MTGATAGRCARLTPLVLVTGSLILLLMAAEPLLASLVRTVSTALEPAQVSVRMNGDSR